MLVLFTGIGPLLAWRRVSWASAKRVFRLPAALALLATLVALLLFTDAAHKPWALALFVFAAFALAGIGQEFWNGAAARRRLSGGSIAAAGIGLVARNRRRYGGYIVHAGIAVLLIGIAASSSFQTNRNVDLRPGQSTVVDGYTIHLRQARSLASTPRSSPSPTWCGSKRTASWSPSCTRAGASSARPASRLPGSRATSPVRRPARSGSTPVRRATSGSPPSPT